MVLEISPPNAVCGGRARFDAYRELNKLANAQRRMLPQRAPEIPGYDLVLAYRPAYMVTGDFHDFFPRPDGGVAAFVGDGSGHGPAACLLVATMRTILRTHPDQHTDPGPTLSFAGRTLAPLISSGEFMTGVYLVLEGEGRVAWASAGHDPPLRVSPSGRIAAVDLTPIGLPLGIEPGEVYPTVRWQLEPRERLVLFTDGLVEPKGRKGEMFGRARLFSEVSGLSHLSLQEMVRELVVRITKHCEDIGFADDFTVLGVERRTNGGSSSSEAGETSGWLSGICE